MLPWRRPKKPKHMHHWIFSAVTPDSLPPLPELDKIQGVRYWITRRPYIYEHEGVYLHCTQCEVVGWENHHNKAREISPPSYIKARKYVLEIDGVLSESPRAAFKDLSGKEYSGVFTVVELNEAFGLLKGYLLQSRTFYMKYVGKWHPDRNTVKMRDDWGDSYTTCPYCTARYKGEDGCPKCGGPAEG